MPEVLRRIGVQSGLDPGRVEQLLAGETGRSEVLAEERTVARAGRQRRAHVFCERPAGDVGRAEA